MHINSYLFDATKTQSVPLDISFEKAIHTIYQEYTDQKLPFHIQQKVKFV